MQQDELAAWLRLLLTPGVGNQTARRLLALCGLPQHIFGQPAVWQGHVNAAQATALRREPADLPALVQATWQWLHSPAGDGVARRILTLADSAYPRALLATDDPPLLLHAMGMAEVLAQDQPFAALRCVARVGSRTPTAQAVLTGRHDVRGYTLATVRLNPLRYVPASKELYLAPRLTVTVDCDAPAGPLRARARPRLATSRSAGGCGITA